MKIYVTARIAEEMKNPYFGQFVSDSIRRHLCGDWGEISEEDKESNNGDRENALSAYKAHTWPKIWIKQTRDIVTVLFPEEY